MAVLFAASPGREPRAEGVSGGSMEVAFPEKWIAGVAAGDRPSDVAVRTLQNRLGAVLQLLPLAAEKAEEDISYIRELRVWTRRATAALGLYEDLLPRRRFSWMKKQLKRIRRAANDARDCDVLIERLRKQPSSRGTKRWLEAVRAEREEAQKAVVDAHERLRRGDRFARRIDKLLQRVRSRGEEEAGAASARFGDWSGQRLRPLVELFFGAVPFERTDEAALHQFRVRGKELRYAMELLAGAFPDEFRTRLYPTIEAMQDRLGEINDLASAKARLHQKLKAASGSKLAAWRRLLASEQAQFSQARQAFWDWCFPRLLQELRHGFEALLDRSTQPGNPRNRPPPATLSALPRAALSGPGPLPEGGEGLPGTGTMTKAGIVAELGEPDLLLPALVNEALAANDRVKYLMTLLQIAREHADHPDLAATDLRQERLACGVPDVELDTVVARSRKEGPDAYLVPASRRIHDLLVDDVRRMLTPLRAQAGSPPANGVRLVGPYEERVHLLLSQAPSLGEDRISGDYLNRLTSGQRDAGDSLHLVVMDLHKELNRLQQRLATETIGGARVYGVREDDRPLIAAFMTGVNQTRELKFGHPGLGTTATRGGERLVIQNDIGMTEAHVLVIHIERQQVTLTYTDVHIDRLIFFQNLFDRFAVRWEDTVSRRAAGLREDLYHLCLGTYVARDGADLLAYLTFLGSRLVFLIDWNRARKRLRKFAPRRVCLQVLRWAADHNYGHRGFLSLGAEQLIFDALQTAGRLPLPPGGQLSDLLGPERTAEFLKFTLQTATEGLRAGRSEFLIRDEVSAELRHYIDTVHQRLLEVAAEHASLVVELALAARDRLLAACPSPDRDLVERTVLRARKWEHRADQLVNRCRAARSRGDAPGPVLDLLVAADDSADGLESAIFWASLLPDDVATGMPVPLNDLAALVLQGAQEYLKAVENARRLHRGSPREHIDDFLEAVDRTLTLEHETDAAHRHAQAGILSFAGDYKRWHLVNGIADKLEEVADALLRSALVLRDYILGEVLRR
jgi:CHAD domain-containing protein/uncharacterized protein Yka (UPF0111/DUF47 family)